MAKKSPKKSKTKINTLKMTPENEIMYDWALREISSVLAHDEFYPENMEKEEFQQVYAAAARAFKSLCEDLDTPELMITATYVMNRLLSNKSLTPITGHDEEWVETPDRVVNRRQTSLVKLTARDGKTFYSDLDRVLTIDTLTGEELHIEVVTRVVDSMQPIELPYIASDTPIKVRAEITRVDDPTTPYNFQQIKLIDLTDLAGNVHPFDDYTLIIGDDGFWHKK